MTRASLDRRRFPTVWADIDLHALGRNLTTLRRYLPVGMAVYGVVKADAYGHGAPAVARALQHAGVDGLVVADLEEGTALRRVGIERPVLVLDPPLPQQATALAAQGLAATVTSVVEAEQLARAAVRTDTAAPVPVHVRADTGFGGLNAPPGSLLDLLAAIARTPALRLAGLYTHLSGHGSMAGLKELERFGMLVAQPACCRRWCTRSAVPRSPTRRWRRPRSASAARRCAAGRCSMVFARCRAPCPFPTRP
ncbi:alanine racemase [Azospirillum canadense]|uniref:alanine racemase n=1 Tax=Azospirillum canadense TaxID=403962 RepID=UPI0022265833|nr:alanine racemase [Azospirillum canadense]MCW2238956.1 alanine racemase [Azospirillum canadense]